MHDNGLFQFFPKYADEEGFLNVKELAPKQRHWRKVEKIKVKEGEFSGIYYVKKCYNQEHLAEILESQIFADFFPNTAIYSPAKVGNGMAVISNDISKNSKTLDSFLESKSKVYDIIPYLLSGKFSLEELRLERFFTPEALKEFVDMHLLDVGCGNIDRHTCNVNVETNNFIIPCFRKITGLKLFDFGCASVFLNEEEAFKKDYDFRNGLGGGVLQSRDQMIQIFKTNELVQSFYTNAQMAEMLGGIDVHEKVVGIKEAMNFNVPQDFEDKLNYSLDYVAEELIK